MWRVVAVYEKDKLKNLTSQESNCPAVQEKTFFKPFKKSQGLKGVSSYSSKTPLQVKDSHTKPMISPSGRGVGFVGGVDQGKASDTSLSVKYSGGAISDDKKPINNLDDWLNNARAVFGCECDNEKLKPQNESGPVLLDEKLPVRESVKSMCEGRSDSPLLAWEKVKSMRQAYVDSLPPEQFFEGVKHFNKLHAEGMASSLQYGLVVVTSHNLLSDTVQKSYGYDNLYYSVDKLKKGIPVNKLDAINHNKSRSSRLYAYDVGWFNEHDVYCWFNDLVFRQNNTFRPIKNENGTTRLVKARGRWSVDLPGGRMVEKRLQEKLEGIENPILLTLTTHEPLIEAIMPNNTNLLPVEWAICNIGTWISIFLKALRQYQKNRGLDWRYYGWVLEFQENGFPHVHIIFSGSWIGRISDISGLWPYCAENGVDLSDRKKLTKKFKKMGKDFSPLRLPSYVAKYVTKGFNAVSGLGVNKSYAWLAFSGGRIFNLAQPKRKTKNENTEQEGQG